MRLRFLVLLVGVLLLPNIAHAQDVPKDRGLVVTPARDFIAVDPGNKIGDKITLTNSTQEPLTIILSVQQFSVADYTYDYRFEAAQDDWIKLGVTQVELLPGNSQEVNYVVSPPASAAPGGHYFTIFATASFGDGTNKSQLRAASLLYVTVRGDLKATSVIERVAFPRVAFGDVNFTLEVKNTGNTHFFAYVSGSFNGAIASQKAPETTHLLLPQAVRDVGGTIAAPLLPGLYTATYGYTTDAGDTVMRVSHVIYLPPWSLLLLAGILWAAIVLVRRILRKRGFKGFLRPPYT